MDQVEEQVSKFQDFQKIKPRLNKLITDFNSEVERTEARREIRDVDFSVSDARANGKLDQSDTFIPIRVIDTNIRREQPPFVAYLKQSKRLMTFSDVEDPSINTTEIENEFTRGMTYEEWEIPHFKCRDGSASHGWAAVEVVFDERYPLHVGLDYVAHEDLIFPLVSEDYQKNEIILRRFTMNISQLESFVVDQGFKAEQVKLIKDSISETERDKDINIYKCFYREGGVIYSGWMENGKTTDWLLAPSMVHLGIQHEEINVEIVADPLGQPQAVPDSTWVDDPIDVYPIILLPYFETEKKRILDYKGRVFQDKHKQEAMTAGWSAFLSAQLKASGIYASLDRDNPGSTNQAKLQSIKITPNAIVDEKVNFFHPDYPDPSMLSALQALEVQNAQEVGQMTFAVQNKKGSRTTATEIDAAREDTGLLTSVQVTLYSTFIRKVYTLAWKIVQSQALQNKIKFLQIKGTKTNNIAVIGRDYLLFAAGDTDVVRKQELLASYKDILPLVQNTAIYFDVLAEVVRLTIQEKGELLANKILAGSPVGIIQSLLSVVTGVAQHEANDLNPDEIEGLTSVIQNANNYLGQMGIKSSSGSEAAGQKQLSNDNSRATTAA